MTNITVFCGSHHGAHPFFSVAASILGNCLAKRGVTLVYGGSSAGTMGELARAALSEGGKVIGYMTQELLTKEKPQDGLTELFIEKSMTERKRKLIDSADAYIVLPGGIGTMEEFFEVLSQSRFSPKPIGILNINNFYDSLFAFCQHAQMQGFISPQHINTLVIHDEPNHLIDELLQLCHSSTLSDFIVVKRQNVLPHTTIKEHDHNDFHLFHSKEKKNDVIKSDETEFPDFTRMYL